MNAQQEVFNTLKEFKRVLLAEKEALIRNDSAKVVAVIAEKENFMEVLPTLDTSGLKKEDLSGIVTEIKNLQETNLLLTQQAVQYQEKMMEAITNSVKTSNTTYSKSGSYSAEKQATIIDQSL